ncbi:redoxin domain-containing protein [Tundrisphaera lichenicola]|uniref:redoxin domain-containing protein n=1 Tax=Tundrisphaera lichenicola TaxID=2029860 RepID=UPI003EBB8C4C
MTTRLIGTFGVATLMVGFALADDKPAAQAPSTKDLMKQALEYASNDEFTKGIGILEKALKSDPDNREALFLLGAMTTYQADQVKEKDRRIALFRKSSEAFAKLKKAHKTLTPNEEAFGMRSRMGEARVHALEGKPEESLATIKAMIADGFSDFEAIESEKDLESVAKLPEMKSLIEKAYESSVAEEKKAIVAEMAEQKSYPFDFSLKGLDGKTVTLADVKGKVTIVDVWGTWCPPCRKEIPHFVSLYETFKPKGLAIVGINCNEQGTPEEVKKTIEDFKAENKVEYPCVLNDEKTEDKIPGFQGYPTTLFLDQTGKVRLTLVGYSPKAKLEAIVSTLLSEEKP